MQTRSRKVEMPSGLSLPLAFKDRFQYQQRCVMQTRSRKRGQGKSSFRYTQRGC
jgi:hypothetical protein